MNNQQTDYKAECMKIYYASDVVDKEKCTSCSGDGYIVDYDPFDPTGQTPMQVQCVYCMAEGFIGHPPTLASWLRLLGRKTYGGELCVDTGVFEHVVDGDETHQIDFNLTTEEPTDWEALYQIIK